MFSKYNNESETVHDINNNIEESIEEDICDVSTLEGSILGDSISIIDSRTIDYLDESKKEIDYSNTIDYGLYEELPLPELDDSESSDGSINKSNKSKTIDTMRSIVESSILKANSIANQESKGNTATLETKSTAKPKILSNKLFQDFISSNVSVNTLNA